MNKEPGKIRQFFLQDIVPNFYAFQAEKILRAKIKEVLEKDLEIRKEGELDENALIDEIKIYHEDERNRKQIIDDKAKASLFIIALSITIILGSLSFIKDPGSRLITTLPVLLLLIIGILYLLLSGVTAIKAFNIREYYSIYLRDRIKEDNGQLAVAKIDNDDLICRHYKNIKLNELTNNIRNNYVYATFAGIRNGIILISIFFIVAVGSIYYTSYEEDNPNKNTETMKGNNARQRQKEFPANSAQEETTTPEIKNKGKSIERERTTSVDK